MKFSEKWSSVYGRMGMVFLSASAVSILVFLADNSKNLPKTEEGASYVKRNGHGEGKRNEELHVWIGDIDEPYTVEIQEQKYTEEELQGVFKKAEKQLELLVLGDNQSLDEVRSDLKLVRSIPDTGIQVTWELDNYEVINPQGKLQTDKIGEEGTLIELKAVLSYEGQKEEYQFHARLFPPKQSQKQQMLKSLDAELARLDDESGSSENMILPSDAAGKYVIWSYEKKFRAVGILMLGVVLTVFVYVSEWQKEKKDKLEREQQLTMDYPQVIGRFTLFLGAGMTPGNAWAKIVGDYEREKEGRKKERAVYEEMAYTMHEMKGGTSESECYERFGERCGLQMYRRFGVMLSQNLKKGTKGLTVLLRQEADNAFEERKSMAKRFGEEAGTKILIPMFLMLAVVLIIIVVPAFLSIQI